MVKVFTTSLLIFSSIAFADSKTYTVKGMHCDDCAKKIEAKLCPTLNAETCKVEVGQVTLVSKNPLDDAKVSKLIKDAGHYTVTGSKPTSESNTPNKEAPASK